MDKSQVNLKEILEKRDEVKKFMHKMYMRQKLSNQFQELWNKKYGKRTGKKKG